jgi:ubiquinone/menaquinone biosynthesis C-methylase UbiE
MSNIQLSAEDRAINQPMEGMVTGYDAYMRKMTLGREQILRQKTIELAQIEPGESVLEVGCGTGSLTLAAKQKIGKTGKAVGIDVIPGMVEYSQKKAEQAQEEISFQLGSINQIPFGDNTFDVVMGSFMIFHMSDKTRKEGIKEIWRVLKPQGRLLFVDLAIPEQPLQKAIAKAIIFRGGLEHNLTELIPTFTTIGFSKIEYASVKFSILGLSVLGFLRGVAVKG